MVINKTKSIFEIFNLTQILLRFIPIIFSLFFVLQPLIACKLWAVCTKTDHAFSTLSFNESLEIENQLVSLYNQSETMADGWSLLGYGGSDADSLRPIQRSDIPATQDSNLYWSAVETLLNDSTHRIGLGHLRLASSGTNTIPNPHPWMFYKSGVSYSLIHNGTVNKNIIYNLITNNDSDLSWLEAHPPQTFGGGDWKEDGWTNVVDSELILLFLMQHIELKGDILAGLQSILLHLVNAGVSASQLNFIFSNGETLFAFGGESGFYFTESSEHYAIMTSPSQTTSLDWIGIGHQELLIFSESNFERYPNFVSISSDQEINYSPNYFSMGNAYPNPFNGGVSFMLDGSASDPVQIFIISINGKLVDQFTISGFENENRIIQWQPNVNMATGTYFVRVLSKGLDKSQKILFIK